MKKIKMKANRPSSKIPMAIFGILGTIGIFALATINVGCEAQPAAAVVQETAIQEKNVAEKGVLDKASDMLQKAKDSGGDSAKQATDWMKQKLGDAAESGGKTADETMKWANDMYRSLKDKGMTTAGSTKEWLTSDWKAMGSWEYKIVKFDSSDLANTEMQLNELGKDSWECFHVTSKGDAEVMYFKKPGKSFLKNVPFKDALHLLPLMDLRQ